MESSDPFSNCTSISSGCTLLSVTAHPGAGVIDTTVIALGVYEIVRLPPLESNVTVCDDVEVALVVVVAGTTDVVEASGLIVVSTVAGGALADVGFTGNVTTGLIEDAAALVAGGSVAVIAGALVCGGALGAGASTADVGVVTVVAATDVASVDAVASVSETCPVDATFWPSGAARPVRAMRPPNTKSPSTPAPPRATARR